MQKLLKILDSWHFFVAYKLSLKTETKLKLLEDRGQISKTQNSPLKNQGAGQPMLR